MSLKTFCAGLCLAAGLVLGTPGGHAAAQESAALRAEIIEFIKQLPEISGTRERLIRQGFSGEKLELAVEHERLILEDRVVTGYIADRLIALYDGNLPRAWAPDGLIGPLFDNGFTHLSVSDMAYYFKVQLAMLQNMPVRDCGMVVKGRISEQRMERVMGQTEARLSAPTLSRYYGIIRKAIHTGVTRQPKLLSPADDARIQERINQKIRERIETDDSLDARTFEALGRASAQDACRAGSLFYEIVLEMKGRDLQHALLYLHAL